MQQTWLGFCGEPKQMDMTPLHYFAELNKEKNDGKQR